MTQWSKSIFQLTLANFMQTEQKIENDFFYSNAYIESTQVFKVMYSEDTVRKELLGDNLIKRHVTTDTVTRN